MSGLILKDFKFYFFFLNFEICVAIIFLFLL
jgi:hypothetical protein